MRTKCPLRAATFRASTAVFLLLVLFGASSGNAATPPDWLKPLLAEDVSKWSKTEMGVSLLDFERVDYLAEDRVRRLTRGAVRVFTSAGLERRYVSLSYNPDVGKIRSARAWVVSPDGRKTRVFKQADFSDSVAQFSSFFWSPQRVIHLPASTARLEIGGVIAWEIELQTESGIFDSSQSFVSGSPLVSGVFEVRPTPGGRIEWFSTSKKLPAPAALDGGGLRWEIRNLPGVSGARPSFFHPNPLRISARCVPAGKTELRTRTWEAFARITGDIIEPQIRLSPELERQAQALIAGKTARWDRVRALTEFIQREISYLSVTIDKDCIAGYRPHTAPDVLHDRYGDCKDKATLLAAMLRAVGDRAYVTLVYSGNPSFVPADWPSACFNHAISAIPADEDTPASWPIADAGSLGRVVLFDPTDHFTPLGVLPPNDQGGLGLIAHGQGSIIRIPGEDPAYNGLTRRTEATLMSDGTLRANVEEIYGGSTAARLQRMRETQRSENFMRSLEERLHDTLPLARGLQWSNTWSAAEARHTLRFSFDVFRHTRSLGHGQLAFSPLLLPERTRLEPWRSHHEGVVWHAAQGLREEARIRLPEGITVEEVPDTWSEKTALGSAALRYRVDGRDLVVEREFLSQSGFVERAEYEALRNLMQKATDAARRPVILRQTSG